MSFKKILAMFIDVLFAIIPVITVSFYLNESLEVVLYKIVFLYFVHTNLILFFSKQFTIGERLMRIGLASISQSEIPYKILFVRNLILCFFMFLIALSWGSLFETALFITLFVSMNLISINNKFKKPMTVLDFIFKTYYTDV